MTPGVFGHLLACSLMTVFSRHVSMLLVCCCIQATGCTSSGPLCSEEMTIEVVLGVVVARNDMVRVAVDLDITADGHVRGSDECLVFVNVLVLSALEELAFDDARVLHGGFVNRDAVVSQVEGDDETTVDILGNAGVEAGSEAEDLLVVVDALEEVTLGLLRDELVDVTESVLLVSETVVGRHNDFLGFARAGVLNLTEVEVEAILALVEVLGVFIDTRDAENAAEGVDHATGGDLVAGQVVVSDEVLSGLVDGVGVGQLLSTEEKGEGVTTIVRVVNFSDLNGVVSEVVVNNEGEVFALGEEAEDLAIVVEELLLGSNLAATEGLLEELLHLVIALGGNFLLGFDESITGRGLSVSLGSSEVLKLGNRRLEVYLKRSTDVEFEFKIKLTLKKVRVYSSQS